ncbi:MAG: hypothetical protein A2133_07900 [Actinobacteria bacterium RBG_16_64_13]|nr:MAG: hypothetical protein A2133_07900 [Actinobacteria bacterium RBG_16_64_13]
MMLKGFQALNRFHLLPLALAMLARTFEGLINRRCGLFSLTCLLFAGGTRTDEDDQYTHLSLPREANAVGVLGAEDMGKTTIELTYYAQQVATAIPRERSPDEDR